LQGTRNVWRLHPDEVQLMDEVETRTRTGKAES
jgi:hypothetical protein